MKKSVVLLITVILIFGIIGVVYADKSCDQACSDAESAEKQAASDARSAKKQAESDARSAEEQAKSDAKSAEQQVESDLESFLQQAESDFNSKIEENKITKVNLEVISGSDGSGGVKQTLKFRGIGVDTNLEVEGLEEGKAKIRLSDGNYQDLNIMPNTAFKIALEKLKTSNINIRLEEFEGEELVVIYVADADKAVKVLGMFETKYNLKVKINVETGEIKVKKKPWWWAFIEEIDEIEDTEMQLIKPIQDIIIMKNEKTSLDLNEYFLNAESYSVSNSENVLIELNENILKIVPEVDWIGTSSITVTAFKGEESLEALFNIIVSEDNLSIQTLQQGAILNEPVRWKKKVKIEEQKRVTLKLPKNSENIIIKTNVGAGEIISSKETEDGLEIEVEEDEDYEVEYYTEAPYAIEKDIAQGKKEITIIGSEEVHYTDVLAFERLSSEVPNDLVKLFLITESGKKEVKVEKYDLNNNSLIDYIEWIVPTLSNETYELELNILNIQSYPTVGGNWEVMFTTAGTANLTISAINDTTYGNSVPDDLTPLELRCGGSALNYDWQGNSVYYSNWNCDNETGYWTVKVLTPGVHVQEFNFGGLIGYAYNFASENISFVSPTPDNNSVQNTDSVYVNITSQEALSSALLNWGNSSGYTNVTMSNSSTTNWYKNMASLNDGNYNFSVWAQNNSGTWVETERRFLLIDSTYPLIDYGTGTAEDNSLVSQNFIYVNTSVTELNEGTIIFLLHNSIGQINSTSYTDSTREINWTGLSDGVYTYNVTINDTFGNTNTTSTRTMTLDTNAPVITFGCDKTFVSTGEVITCSCSATSATDSDPIVSYTQNPTTTNAGAFTTTCTALDDAGVSSSSSISYAVESSDGGYPSYRPKESELSKGYERIMYKNWEISFKIENVSHMFKVDDITERIAKISISSETQEATLSVGEEKKFELSGDDYYDILVKLNSIDLSLSYKPKAKFTIQTIHEEILEEIIEEEEIAKEESIEESKKNLTWLWIIIAVIIILILVKTKYKVKKRKKR